MHRLHIHTHIYTPIATILVRASIDLLTLSCSNVHVARSNLMRRNSAPAHKQKKSKKVRFSSRSEALSNGTSAAYRCGAVKFDASQFGSCAHAHKHTHTHIHTHTNTLALFLSFSLSLSHTHTRSLTPPQSLPSLPDPLSFVFMFCLGLVSRLYMRYQLV